jgi:hypothetical protein
MGVVNVGLTGVRPGALPLDPAKDKSLEPFNFRLVTDPFALIGKSFCFFFQKKRFLPYPSSRPITRAV